MSTRHLHPDSKAILALLAVLVTLGPLSIDMYLPAMPAMADTLGTSMADMQLTISAYLAGFALCHLVCGPLSDRFGRKPLLLGGTTIFVAACIGCAQSDNLQELLSFRFLQGVGACVGPTLARATTRDIFGPTRAAQALSYIAMLMALAPAVAPTLGGLMLQWLPWSSLFVFLALYGTVLIPLVQLYLPESLPHRQSLRPRVIAGNYLELIRHPTFLLTTAGGAVLYSGLMSYLGASSMIYIVELGVPVHLFGLIFLTTVLGYMTGSFTSARLAGRQAPELIGLLGAAICIVATTLMVGLNLIWGRSIVNVAGPAALFSVGMGMVLPNAMASALRPFPHIAGTASALLGFIQMGLSAVIAGALGRLLDESATPVLIGMWALSCACLVLLSMAWRRMTPADLTH